MTLDPPLFIANVSSARLMDIKMAPVSTSMVTSYSKRLCSVDQFMLCYVMLCTNVGVPSFNTLYSYKLHMGPQSHHK